MEFLLKSTFVLSLFYAFYKIFLQNETFFKSIRVYFLIGFILAIAIPLIVITKYIEVEPINLSNVNFINATSTLPNSNFDWMQVIIITYLIGVVFFSIRFLYQLSSLLWFLYQHPKTKKGNHFMVKTDKNKTPFSFFNYIVYNSNQFKELELKQIISHEKIHVNQFHSLDTILSQLALILNWFNPFIWLYSKEVQKNLEYIADEYAQNIAQEKKNYQHLLLKTVSPNYQMALTSNFYNSLIKNRINMLQKNRSNKTMYFKFVLIIPILIAFIFTFNTEIIAQQKRVKTVETQTNYEVEIITKDFQKDDLEKLKTRLSTKGISLKYSKLKYNSKNEITGLNLNIKNTKGNQSSLSQNSSDPINPIRIKVNKETGAMEVGNFSEHNLHENIFISSGDSKKHKKIIVKKMGDGIDDADVIWVSGDSTKVVDLKGDNNFVFITDDETTELSMGNDNKKSYTYKIKRVGGDNDIRVGTDQAGSSNLWVSKNGDSTKVKIIEIIEIDEDSGDTHKVIVKSDDKKHSKHGNMMFIDSDGKKPLFFVDGKEIENGKLEDIDPDNIENVEIYKGDKAVEKYGEKAKDGVILITTKKN